MDDLAIRALRKRIDTLLGSFDNVVRSSGAGPLFDRASKGRT
jgi:hypothetical protein